MVVAVWRWPCGGHMTCHVTWQDNPLRVTIAYTIFKELPAKIRNLLARGLNWLVI